MCVAVANIEKIQEEVKKFPYILGYSFLDTKIKPQICKEIIEVAEEAALNFQALLEAFIVKVLDKVGSLPSLCYYFKLLF